MTSGPEGTPAYGDSVSGSASPEHSGVDAGRRPGGVGLWVQGARPRTLPAAVVPVAVGTAAVNQVDGASIMWWRAAAALVVALALQIATNFVNDYADGQRGTDDARLGPARLVGGGAASVQSVKRAALVSFAVAGLAGLALAVAVGPELIGVGLVSMVAAWAYTGGPRPYGYDGLGEVFVFVFFGLVATIGSTYVHTDSVVGLSVLAAVPVGLLAVALLVVNNLRDIPTDEISGKKTLAVRMGDRATRFVYVALFVVVGVFVVLCTMVAPMAFLALVGLLLAVEPARAVLKGAAGRDLITTLGHTGRAQMATGMLLAVGVFLS